MGGGKSSGQVLAVWPAGTKILRHLKQLLHFRMISFSLSVSLGGCSHLKVFVVDEDLLCIWMVGWMILFSSISFLIGAHCFFNNGSECFLSNFPLHVTKFIGVKEISHQVSVLCFGLTA